MPAYRGHANALLGGRHLLARMWSYNPPASRRHSTQSHLLKSKKWRFSCTGQVGFGPSHPTLSC